MKPQDIIFLLLFGFIIWKQPHPKRVALMGILCILFSIPLFSAWIFFTAQRLIWYAAAFFALSVILTLLRLRKNTI